MKWQRWLLLFLFIIVSGVYAEVGVTDNQVVFGQSASFKGSSSALGSELWRGSQAYFDHINKNGGVKGRKIRVIALDDSYDPTKALLNTIDLIRKKKVFNLYGYVGTPTIVKALPVLQKFSTDKMILFSNFTGAQAQRELPHRNYVFNIRSSYRQELKAIVDNLYNLGHRRFGLFIQNDAYGRSGADGVLRALKIYGLDVVAETTYERGDKYTKLMLIQVKRLLDRKVSAVISVGAYEACAAFIRDARLHGLNVPIANVSFVGAESMLNLLVRDEKRLNKQLTNTLLNSQVVPLWSNQNIPLVKEYRKIMMEYNPKVPNGLKNGNYQSSQFSFVSLEGFLNAKVLVEALQRAPKKLTRKNFIDTLESMREIDVGLERKLSFSKSRHQASDMVFFTTVEKGKFVTVNDWKVFK